MSAATTPSQLFLQAAGMSSGWAQNAQQMQFARERAGVYDRNAAADDAFRREQWEAQQKAFRDRLAQEDAQRRANATITKLLLAPQDQPIVPQGPGIENGVMPEVDFRTMVDDESLQHASPGLASLLTSTSFDRQKAQREWNQTAATLDELMRGNRSQMAPEIVKKALAMGMHVPFEKMPRGMRESLQHDDAGLKQMMLGDMGIAEGSPEYERFMGGDRVGSGLNERYSRWQKQKAIDDAKRGALAESGIMPTVADPATGQEVPNPQHAAMMKLPAAELEGTLKQMLQTRLGEISSKARAGQPLTPEEQGLAVKYLSQSEANPARTNFQSLYKAQGEAAASELKVIDDQYADLLNRIKDLQDQAYTAQEIQGMLSPEEKQQLVQYRAEKADASRRAVDLFRQAQGVGGAPQTPPQTQPRTLTPQQQAIAQVVDQLRKSLGKEPTRDEIKAALQQAGGVFIQN